MSEWFETAFDTDYLTVYGQFEQEPIWQMDCDFLMRQLRLEPGEAVLDLCCGSGRHSIELARRGMKMTGLDLSPSLIEHAQRRAAERGVEVTWLCEDARDLDAHETFDAVFNYLTSFGYHDQAGNEEILRRVYRALKPGGRFLIEKINTVWLLGNFVKTERRVYDGFTYVERRSYDARSGRIEMVREKLMPDGTVKPLPPFSVRAHLPSTLVEMLEAAGFAVGPFVASPTGQEYQPFLSPRMAIVACRPL